MSNTHQRSVETRKKTLETFKKYGLADSWIKREGDPINKIGGYKIYKEGKAKKIWPDKVKLGNDNIFLTIKIASSNDTSDDPKNWKYTQDVIFNLLGKTYVVKEFGSEINLYLRETPNKLYPHSCGCIHWEQGIKGNIWDNYCKHNWAAFYCAVDELDSIIKNSVKEKDFSVYKNARIWKNEDNNEEVIIELYEIKEELLNLYERVENSSLKAYEKTDVLLAYLFGLYPKNVWDLGRGFKKSVEYILKSKHINEIEKHLKEKINL
ncbi:MAG: hypothetical protein KQA40_02995 [Candidatus Aenigmarchaeota archaeon]|nr:hypothetical protein [Candidatus Aenigmarchaeota archaeon]